MISAATLRSGHPLGVDLYCYDAGTNRIGLYKQADYPLTERDLERLQAEGTRRLYIHEDAHKRYQEHLRLLLADIADNSPFSTRAGAMDEIVRDVLRTCFQAGDVERTVASALDLGEMVVKVLMDEPHSTAELFQILHHDHATFTHSANAAYFATLLAKELGLPSGELRRIATGALLHDIGKMDIDDSILCKPGRLDEFEIRQVRQHPLEGFRKLCRQRDLSQGQLLMAYQHHEKLDGSGYPVGCVGEEIHPWAKLCAVVDSFESLTSIRPYRGPRTHERALQIMEQDCGLAYEPEMFQCWKKIIESCSPA